MIPAAIFLVTSLLSTHSRAETFVCVGEAGAYVEQGGSEGELAPLGEKGSSRPLRL